VLAVIFLSFVAQTSDGEALERINPFRLDLQFSAAGLESSLPLLPVTIDLIQNDGRIDLNQPRVLSKRFRHVDGAPPIVLNAKSDPVQTFRLGISNFDVSGPQISELFIKISDIDYFSDPELRLNRYPLLFPPLCEVNREENSADCKIQFPTLKLEIPHERPAQIRVRFFKKGRLPQSLLLENNSEEREQMIEEAIREKILHDDVGEVEGFFLTSTYVFDDALDVLDFCVLSEKDRSLHLSLKMLPGRLVVLPGQYLVEVEVYQTAESAPEVSVRKITARWNQTQSLGL
jgi:hypothetical protein